MESQQTKEKNMISEEMRKVLEDWKVAKMETSDPALATQLVIASAIRSVGKAVVTKTGKQLADEFH